MLRNVFTDPDAPATTKAKAKTATAFIDAPRSKKVDDFGFPLHRARVVVLMSLSDGKTKQLQRLYTKAENNKPGQKGDAKSKELYEKPDAFPSEPGEAGGQPRAEPEPVHGQRAHGARAIPRLRRAAFRARHSQRVSPAALPDPLGPRTAPLSLGRRRSRPGRGRARGRGARRAGLAESPLQKGRHGVEGARGGRAAAARSVRGTPRGGGGSAGAGDPADRRGAAQLGGLPEGLFGGGRARSFPGESRPPPAGSRAPLPPLETPPGRRAEARGAGGPTGGPGPPPALPPLVIGGAAAAPPVELSGEESPPPPSRRGAAPWDVFRFATLAAELRVLAPQRADVLARHALSEQAIVSLEATFAARFAAEPLVAADFRRLVSHAEVRLRSVVARAAERGGPPSVRRPPPPPEAPWSRAIASRPPAALTETADLGSVLPRAAVPFAPGAEAASSAGAQSPATPRDKPASARAPPSCPRPARRRRSPVHSALPRPAKPRHHRAEPRSEGPGAALRRGQSPASVALVAATSAGGQASFARPDSPAPGRTERGASVRKAEEEPPRQDQHEPRGAPGETPAAKAPPKAPEPAPTPPLPLERHASLHAELATYPERRAAVLLRYQVDERALGEADRAFKQRFAEDPTLHRRWQCRSVHDLRGLATRTAVSSATSRASASAARPSPRGASAEKPGRSARSRGPS